MTSMPVTEEIVAAFERLVLKYSEASVKQDDEQLKQARAEIREFLREYSSQQATAIMNSCMKSLSRGFKYHHSLWVAFEKKQIMFKPKVSNIHHWKGTFEWLPFVKRTHDAGVTSPLQQEDSAREQADHHYTERVKYDNARGALLDLGLTYPTWR